MYVYCTGVCIYSTYILHNSIHTLVVQPYTIQDEAGTPLTPRKYNILNGNFGFNLCDFYRNVTLAKKETCLYCGVE